MDDERYLTLLNLSVVADNLHRAENGLLSFDHIGQLDALRHLHTAIRQVVDIMNELQKEERHA